LLGRSQRLKRIADTNQRRGFGLLLGFTQYEHPRREDAATSAQSISEYCTVGSAILKNYVKMAVVDVCNILIIIINW
jgi:hypothetical protein|tara:strand:+ start:52 stop:282 length:231 start_codon:yes stop_codon:yes gene_type:complete